MPCSAKAALRFPGVSLAAFVILGGMMASPPAIAQETDPDCRSIWAPPEIQVEGIMAPPRFDNSKSSDQIAQIARQNGYARSLHQASLLGLTYAFTGPNIAVETRYRKGRDGRQCVRLHSMKFSFGARSTDVYVARKYRPGSCAYDAILSHEMEHVRINERIIGEYIARFEKALIERAAAIQPFYNSDVKRAGQSIGNRLRFELDPLLDEFDKARLQANDAIDTAESYAATYAKCSDW